MGELAAAREEWARGLEERVRLVGRVLSAGQDQTPTPALAGDAINPSHYRSHSSGIEAIELTEHAGFNLGNAIKYAWRVPLKHQTPHQDLRKCAWYLKRFALSHAPWFVTVDRSLLTRVLDVEPEGSALHLVLLMVDLVASYGPEPKPVGVREAILNTSRLLYECSFLSCAELVALNMIPESTLSAASANCAGSVAE